MESICAFNNAFGRGNKLAIIRSFAADVKMARRFN